ncbi:flagellar basal body L-ring protein FlgH [Acidimangrovimonas sediminis]|uniref:flagellar basal body L-ring protein FlgH n=1 Tax=Acidimangrovimonas sediminis TaxID=2056283 RepID=UPI000C80A302|nr:flagellar basal body L-ring protein FlgH [Acidimangrovimonas sediminis]
MSIRPVPILLATALLAGCQQYRDARDPKVSDIDLSAKTMPEVASIQVPMPPPEVKPAPMRAEAASLWRTGSTGFFGDQRATKVGDILTVDINIDDNAKLSNASKRSRDGSQTVGNPTFLGYEKRLHSVLPGVNKSDMPTGDNIADLSSSSSSNGSGSIDRNESISLKVAAMVLKKLPNGEMVVAGRQEVKVNHELRELRVAGIIRPQDIRMDNTIPYEKMAEARITYGGKGQLSSVQQPRYGDDFLNVVLPY